MKSCKKALTVARQRLNDGERVSVYCSFVTDYYKGKNGDRFGRWYKDSKTHSISQENSQGIAVIDPLTPKSHEKRPYMTPCRDFLFFA